MWMIAIIIVFCLSPEASSLGVYYSNVSLPPSNMSNKIFLFEGQMMAINQSLTYNLVNQSYTNNTLVIRCGTDYDKVATLTNWTDLSFLFDPFDSGYVDLTLTVSAKRLGGSNIYCDIRYANDTAISLHRQQMATLIVRRVPTIDEQVFKYGIIILLIILTFMLGCEVDRRVIAEYFKRPISPSIGFACQFMIMPLAAFGLAKVTNIDNAFGFGLLTIGCSPGGGASNLWTVLLGGDLDLSMTMTFISCCAAFFMMPFWLFVLGRFFIDPGTLSIPYGQIGLNLLLILIPVGIGILFRWKFEKKAVKVGKKVKIMALIFVVYILTYGSYVNLFLYKLIGDYPYLLPIGAGLPWIGFALGYIFALIFRQTKAQAIAIALETGIQNMGISILILKYSLPQPAGDLGTVMTLIVVLFTPFPLYLTIAVIAIMKKCAEKNNMTEKEKPKPIEMKQKESLLDKNDI